MGPHPVFRAAGLALFLTFLVVVAAAGIRHGVDPALLRPLHRVAATLVVPAVLWMAWRSRRSGFLAPSLVAVALTLALSVVGVLGGKAPPPWIAATNLLGGLALAALLAWLAGKDRGRSPNSLNRFPAGVRAPSPIFLLGVQVALGAWISISGSLRVLPLHGLAAMLVAALLGWFALSRVRGAAGKVLFAAAIAAPIAGMTSLQYEHSAVAAMAHAAAAALLVCAAAWSAARAA